MTLNVRLRKAFWSLGNLFPTQVLESLRTRLREDRYVVYGHLDGERGQG